ncbi:hypothetical protein MPSEU_000880600 [Mayamaea pseudoterrestris]|nr:hypothetical protein MPSEU_000880600 [Mayamaea pseudoterrestris]
MAKSRRNKSSPLDEEGEPPKPVSSDSEEEEIDFANDVDDKATAADDFSATRKATLSPMSRLFAPYRSLGIVSSGCPFDILSHETATMLCVPIQDRFQILSERLQPVMVSQRVNHGTIRYLVADATLSVTLVAHGATRVTLFHRTMPLQTKCVQDQQSRGCSITSLLRLGRLQKEMKGEKQGKTENAVIVAAVLARSLLPKDASIPVVGDDEEEETEGDFEEKNTTQPVDLNSVCGQVVMMIATREDLAVQGRINLDFVPVIAVHPPTYVNKIVVAGYKNVTTAEGDSVKHPAMNLINVRSGKVLYVFNCLPVTNDAYVTTLEASPAVDTLAVGTSSGKVHLINVLHDKLLFTLDHKSIYKVPVSITSISFRTDSSAFQYGIAPMAVGRNDDIITIWDLTPSENHSGAQKVLTELENVHVGGVGYLQYLPHEPLLVSIGIQSNSIVMHLFDSPNHTGRILRQRKGHSSPPNLIRYLHPATGGLTQHDGTDALACQILSTGGSDRSLRVFSTARTILDKEYSQGPGLEKRARKLGIRAADIMLPPVTALAVSESNRRDWGDLVTIHRDHPFAYVWSNTRGSQSGPLLKQAGWNISAMKAAPSRQTHATSVCMSACGHFAIVGTRGGFIYKYNVQSGHARGAYPRTIEVDANGKKQKSRLPGDVGRTMKALESKMKISNRVSNLDKHDIDGRNNAALEQARSTRLAAASHKGSAVTGLAVDSLNKFLVSVGEDKKLVVWHFTTHVPHCKSPFILPFPAVKLKHVRESDLAAIALKDYSVVLFDCTSLSIVRRFGAQGYFARHGGPVTDLAFSPDARTLYTASMDRSIRVFDVPTNACIDWLSFKSAPTSLTISPTGEYLATTHHDRVGICVWSDRSYYQTIHMDSLYSTEPVRMDEPTPMLDKNRANCSSVDVSLLVDATYGPNKNRMQADDGTRPCSKKGGLVTFSGLPHAHWKNIFYLELVKLRNKPSEAPKKPPTAPFFLQWRNGEAVSDAKDHNMDAAKEETFGTDNNDDWAKAWSDEEYGQETLPCSNGLDSKRNMSQVDIEDATGAKRHKIFHVRSQLASLLTETAASSGSQRRYQHVTEHIATLGPSAIDVALASLCNGFHDLNFGLPLLRSAAAWLIEALLTGERFEAVNAYLHRFLFLHAAVIAGLEILDAADERHMEDRRHLMEAITQLRRAQEKASHALNNKMQHGLCLLRHFSRMV